MSVLSKLNAKLLLNHLKAAGAEARLWSRQFGFRSKRSTEDALFIVRRRVEQALASRGGRAFLLALDWRKAFDSIAPERLIWALERFGVNGPMLAAIQEIYANRDFTVSDGGVDSQSRPQKAGISQGCPLSPFLFGMVMTVLMWDARNALSTEAKLACDKGELEDTLFADDTLLIGRCGEHIEEYMAQVELKGRDYGLQVHWGKVCLVKVCVDSPVHGPNGQVLEAKDSMLYLGSTIHANGKFGCEVSRKIGAASAEFKLLHRVWKNASIPKRRKLRIFDAMILSKLRYALASSWLVKANLRRLDGFEAACLRKLLGIKHSFWSRVSNAKVRQIAGQTPFSETVRASQFKLLGQVLMDPHKQILREVAFHGGDLQTPETAAYVRRVGRPKQIGRSSCAASCDKSQVPRKTGSESRDRKRSGAKRLPECRSRLSTVIGIFNMSGQCIYNISRS